MKPQQDLEIMEELLLEHSICHYYEEHKFLYQRDMKLNAEWVKARTINDHQFDNLEKEYAKLALLLGKEPKIYNQMSVSPMKVSVQKKIVQMSFVPTKLLVWPLGYDEIDSIVDSAELEKRIEHLFEKKREANLLTLSFN